MEDFPTQSLQTLRATSFRRPRSGRACAACHSRRIRCDAATRGLPCTNCAAFSKHCTIPPRKKVNRRKSNGLASEGEEQHKSELDNEVHLKSTDSATIKAEEFDILLADANRLLEKQPRYTDIYLKLVKEDDTKTAIHDPGRVAYLDELSYMSLILNDYEEPSAVHYAIPRLADAAESSTRVDPTDMAVLQNIGAFSLPPRQLCDDLVYAFFTWVAPIVPIINRNAFLRRYRDPNNPPSILLLQAILLAGSRVCSTPSLMDSSGSPIPASSLFYQRAKALYNAEYEEDRVTIIQSLILLGWHWEDQNKVAKDIFYWNGIAILIAQGCGMHRSTKSSALDPADKRLWKRIWWTLVTRDRLVAVAVGRPMHINLAYSDVEKICHDDFVDEDGYSASLVHIDFFIQYVKLCEIMGVVVRQNYSISRHHQQHSSGSLAECEQILEEWMADCPAELKWNPDDHRFWAAYLHCMFYTVVSLLHRAYLPPPSRASTSSNKYPAAHAASMITSVVESLVVHKEIKLVPPFIIYSMLSSLLFQIYELQVNKPSELTEGQKKQILLCLDALKLLSNVWLVARMTYNIFEQVLGSMGFGRLLESTTQEKARDLQGNSEIDEVRHSTENTLTPALVAHAHAALGSAGEQVEAEEPRATDPPLNFSNDIESWQGTNVDSSKLPQTLIQNTELYGSHSLDWMEGGNVSDPAPTGIDVNQWFDNFFKAGENDGSGLASSTRN